MRAKPAQRIEAERLRREEGLSYNEISALTGLSKSTLSHWLRDIELAPELQARLKERLDANRARFVGRAWSVNRERYAQARAKAYHNGEVRAAELPEQPSVRELALAMLYLGEGSKRGNRVQMASTDARVLRYFVYELIDLYRVVPDRLTYRLNLVEAARPIEAELRAWWIDQLGCQSSGFRKTQYDSRSTATSLTSDYYGVCTVTYHDTYLQERLAGLASAYLQQRASAASNRPAGVESAGGPISGRYRT